MTNALADIRMTPDDALAWLIADPGRRLLIVSPFASRGNMWRDKFVDLLGAGPHIPFSQSTIITQPNALNGRLLDPDDDIVVFTGFGAGANGVDLLDDLRTTIRTMWSGGPGRYIDASRYEDVCRVEPWEGGVWMKVLTQDPPGQVGDFPLVRQLLVHPDAAVAGASAADPLFHLSVGLYRREPREYPPEHAPETGAGIALTRATAVKLRDALNAYLNHEAPPDLDALRADQIRSIVEETGDPFVKLDRAGELCLRDNGGAYRCHELLRASGDEAAWVCTAGHRWTSTMQRMEDA